MPLLLPSTVTTPHSPPVGLLPSPVQRPPAGRRFGLLPVPVQRPGTALRVPSATRLPCRNKRLPEFMVTNRSGLIGRRYRSLEQVEHDELDRKTAAGKGPIGAA